MIVLDTHILLWWINESSKLMPEQQASIEENETVAVSAISFWEIAKLVEKGRILLDRPVLDWINAVLAHPKIQLIPLTPEIIARSTQLPEGFHNDPADQLIVATTLHLDCVLLTQDTKILAFTHVSTL